MIEVKENISFFISASLPVDLAKIYTTHICHCLYPGLPVQGLNKIPKSAYSN